MGELMDEDDIKQHIVDTNNDGMKDDDEIEKMDGPRKQFYNFLKEYRLEKYFNKFEENECCNIGDIEYFMNDQTKEFLEKDIGIKKSKERIRFERECKKL